MISNCPSDIGVSVTSGTQTTQVSWTEPTATDDTTPADQLTMVATHTVPATLAVGVVTQVRYLWQDADNNIAECAFNISVQGEMIQISK